MTFFKRMRFALVFRDCARVTFVLALVQIGVSNLCAQTSTQQRVYGSASVTTNTSVLPGYAKDSTTGALTALAGASFSDKLEGGLVAIDGQGKFLFVLNPVSNRISMYQIDGSNGALTEVPNSRFAAGPTVNPNMAPSHPISLDAEIIGKFLYVGYANGDSTTTSALIPVAIDAANLEIVLTPQLSLDFGNGAPVQFLSDPKGLRLYVGLGPGGNQPAVAAGTMVYSIDGSNGVLTAVGNAGGGSDWGRAIAIDPRGRFFFEHGEWYLNLFASSR
jgi:6-phosphogluconolactonase (cycloisomerase 2 family)